MHHKGNLTARFGIGKNTDIGLLAFPKKRYMKFRNDGISSVLVNNLYQCLHAASFINGLVLCPIIAKGKNTAIGSIALTKYPHAFHRKPACLQIRVIINRFVRRDVCHKTFLIDRYFQQVVVIKRCRQKCDIKFSTFKL